MIREKLEGHKDAYFHVKQPVFVLILSPNGTLCVIIRETIIWPNKIS